MFIIHKKALLSISFLITNIRIFITFEQKNRLFALILYVRLLTKNKLDYINITSLQKHCSNNERVIMLFILQNLILCLYHEMLILI